MLVLVNDKTYDIQDKRIINNMLKMAKDALKWKNAIYAVEKSGYLEMRKDVFPTKQELLHEVVKLTKSGYNVHYNINKKEG